MAQKLKKVLKNMEEELLNGYTYSVPGETTLARETTLYCVQSGSHCHTCSLVNYGRDCHNNKIEDNVSGCRICNK